VNKKWMPITAGVLDIIHGVLLTFCGLLWILIYPWLQTMGSSPWYHHILFPLLVVIGVLAIVGGIYAIKRKVWPLVLVGAIVALIPPVAAMYDFWEGFNPSYFFSLPTLMGFIGIPAIVAIILTVLSKKQFERK